MKLHHQVLVLVVLIINLDYGLMHKICKKKVTLHQKMKHINQVYNNIYIYIGSLINPVIKEYKLTFVEVWSIGKEVDILST